MDDIRSLYRDGVNIIEHLGGRGYSRSEAIELSYDVQAGSYVAYNSRHPAFVTEYTVEMAEVIRGLGAPESVLEVGCGEATTLTPLLGQLPPTTSLGFDLSWSRVRFGLEYAAQRLATVPTLFVGDLFDIPLPDGSVDLVYTYHSLEPNGGQELAALRELHRVARRYVVLFEPAYELADGDGRARMERLGYVRGLRSAAEQLGLRVLEYRRARVSKNALNPTAILVLERTPVALGSTTFRCPYSHDVLGRRGGVYASERGVHVYPIVGRIPCLSRRHAIVASHFLEFEYETEAPVAPQRLLPHHDAA